MKQILAKKEAFEPEVLRVPDFTALYTDFCGLVADYISDKGGDKAKAFDQLMTPSEPFAVCAEACVLVYQDWLRRYNASAKQMFAVWAKGEMLDAKAADLGIVRRSGEDDESLLQRYKLKAYSFSSAGSESAYRYHAITLGDAPSASLVKSDDGKKLTVEYSFDQSDLSSYVLDAAVRRIDDKGSLQIALLLKKSSDDVKEELLSRALSYLNGPEVRAVNDSVEVVEAESLGISLHFKCSGIYGPTQTLISAELSRLAKGYIDSLQMGGSVDIDYLRHLAYSVGVSKFELLTDSESVSWNQKLFCEDVKVEFSI